MLVKKSVYKILCKGATSGKEAYTMLQEYVMGSIYNMMSNILDENGEIIGKVNEDIKDEDIEYVIFDNVFPVFEKMKARNEKETDLMLYKLIDEELSSLVK